MAKHKKLIKYFNDNYVGDDIIRKAKELVNENTDLKWNTAYVYGKGKLEYRIERGIKVAVPEFDRARSEYRRLGLEFISSKEEMAETLSKSHSNFWESHNLDEYWQQYLLRDKLIAAGLYEKAKQEVYFEKYMEVAAIMLGDSKPLEDIAGHISKLTPEQFSAVTKPSGDKNKTTTAFPSIQELYLIAGIYTDREHYEDFTERVKKAFNEAGVPWEEQPIVTTEDEAIQAEEQVESNYKRYKNITKDKSKLKSTYGRTLKTIFKSSPEEVREKIAMGIDIDTVDDIFKERKEALRALYIKEQNLLKRGKALVMISQNGELYIPFVRKDIVTDYLKTYYGK